MNPSEWIAVVGICGSILFGFWRWSIKNAEVHGAVKGELSTLSATTSLGFEHNKRENKVLFKKLDDVHEMVSDHIKPCDEDRHSFKTELELVKRDISQLKDE